MLAYLRWQGAIETLLTELNGEFYLFLRRNNTPSNTQEPTQNSNHQQKQNAIARIGAVP